MYIYAQFSYLHDTKQIYSVDSTCMVCSCVLVVIDLFQKLFRQDLLVASLFRNFLLAERIMRSYDCTPVSSPKLPPTYQVNSEVDDSYFIGQKVSYIMVSFVLN